MTRPLVFRVPPEVAERIDEFAAENGISRSAAVRVLLNRAFEEHHQQKEKAIHPKLERMLVSTAHIVAEILRARSLEKLPPPEVIKQKVDATIREMEGENAEESDRV